MLFGGWTFGFWSKKMKYRVIGTSAVTVKYIWLSLCFVYYKAFHNLLEYFGVQTRICWSRSRAPSTQAQGQLGSLVSRYARLGVWCFTSLEYTGPMEIWSHFSIEIWRFLNLKFGDSSCTFQEFGKPLVIHMDSGYIQLSKHVTSVAYVWHDWLDMAPSLRERT